MNPVTYIPLFTKSKVKVTCCSSFSKYSAESYGQSFSGERLPPWRKCSAPTPLLIYQTHTYFFILSIRLPSFNKASQTCTTAVWLSGFCSTSPDSVVQSIAILTYWLIKFQSPVSGCGLDMWWVYFEQDVIIAVLLIWWPTSISNPVWHASIQGLALWAYQWCVRSLQMCVLCTHKQKCDMSGQM